LEQYRREESKLAWEGTFADYLELVAAKPAVAQLSHARVYQMLAAAGGGPGGGGGRGGVFAGGVVGGGGARRARDEDFGSRGRRRQQLYEYFGSAARRLEVRKRILLLMGPVGGGKSTIVSLLKRGLERYARTEAGAVYAIKGCPMHEEPLHLVPEVLRAELQR